MSYIYNIEDYKLNDKGQSQIVHKEIYKESNYLNAAHYQVNNPFMDNDWACQESEWGLGVNVDVSKDTRKAFTSTSAHTITEEEIFSVGLYKTFGFDRSTDVEVYMTREQLEHVVERAQKVLDQE